MIEHRVLGMTMFKHDDYTSAPVPTNSSHPHLGSVPRNLKSAFDEIKLRFWRNKSLHSHFSGLATVTLLFYCAAGEDVKQDSTRATKI